MTEHKVADIPIKPSTNIIDAWETYCECGWGANCDSPEAAVIGLAWHLLPTLTTEEDTAKYCLCSEPDYCLRGDTPEYRGRAIAYRKAHGARLPITESETR